MTPARAKALAALLAALATFVVGWFASPTDTNTRTVTTAAVKPHDVTVDLKGPNAAADAQTAGKVTDKITLSPEAQAITETQAALAKGDDAGVEVGLHESKQPSADTLRLVRERAPPGQGAIPAEIPLAAPSQSGCTTALVGNYSHRAAGTRVDLGVIHWTGSTPTLGSPASGLAIVNWFNQARSQASSHYVTDQDGRCWMTVPEALKAWTEVQANSWSLSVEIVNIGTAHPLFQTTAARDAVVNLMIGWHHRWGLPYQHAKVDGNCVPIRSGFLDHKDLGPCGGGHPDVDGYDLDGLIALAAARDHPCNPSTTCARAKELRGKHQRTHQRIVKNDCKAHQGAGYCSTLRHRNKAVHLAAKRDHVSLAGTYK